MDTCSDWLLEAYLWSCITDACQFPGHYLNVREIFPLLFWVESDWFEKKKSRSTQELYEFIFQILVRTFQINDKNKKEEKGHIDVFQNHKRNRNSYFATSLPVNQSINLSTHTRTHFLSFYPPIHLKLISPNTNSMFGSNANKITWKKMSLFYEFKNVFLLLN